MKRRRQILRGQCPLCHRWLSVGRGGFTWPHRCGDLTNARRLVLDVQTPARQCAQFVRAIVPVGTSEAEIQMEIDAVMDRFGYGAERRR